MGDYRDKSGSERVDAPEKIDLTNIMLDVYHGCLLYTSDAADEEDSVDLGGRRLIEKKKTATYCFIL